MGILSVSFLSKKKEAATNMGGAVSRFVKLVKNKKDALQALLKSNAIDPNQNTGQLVKATINKLKTDDKFAIALANLIIANEQGKLGKPGTTEPDKNLQKDLNGWQQNAFDEPYNGNEVLQLANDLQSASNVLSDKEVDKVVAESSGSSNNKYITIAIIVIVAIAAIYFWKNSK